MPSAVRYALVAVLVAAAAGAWFGGRWAYDLYQDDLALRQSLSSVSARLETIEPVLDSIHQRTVAVDRLSLATIASASGRVKAGPIGGAGLNAPAAPATPLAPATDPARATAGDPAAGGESVASIEARIHDLRAGVQRLDRELGRAVTTIRDRRELLASLPTMMPAQGPISSEFGMRLSPTKGVTMLHKGLDIAAPEFSEVVAPADGVVRFAGNFGGFGNFVSIDHGHGIVTKYAHNADVLVKTGQRVKRGQPIAEVGQSGRCAGIHLHYEIWVNDQPVNPRLFLGQDFVREQPVIASTELIGASTTGAMLKAAGALPSFDAGTDPAGPSLTVADVDLSDPALVKEALAEGGPDARQRLVRSYLSQLRAAAPAPAPIHWRRAGSTLVFTLLGLLLVFEVGSIFGSFRRREELDDLEMIVETGEHEDLAEVVELAEVIALEWVEDEEYALAA